MAGKPREPRRYFDEVVLPYDGNECLLWPYATKRGGYGQVTHEGRSRRINRVVCEIVHGPAPSPEHHAAHSCGNTRCVAKSHLSWKTKAENEADKLLHGTHNRGERHGMSKLKAEQVREIRALCGSASQASVARKFGIGEVTVSRIVHGKTWEWLDA